MNALPDKFWVWVGVSLAVLASASVALRWDHAALVFVVASVCALWLDRLMEDA